MGDAAMLRARSGVRELGTLFTAKGTPAASRHASQVSSPLKVPPPPVWNPKFTSFLVP